MGSSMPKILKNTIFGGLVDKLLGIYAILPPSWQFSYKRENVAGGNLGERGPQNRFLTAVATVAT
jgi:hypothetical protein